ncbi:J domain-containing protein [Actinokineospora sp. NPDC004072]
MSLNIDYYQVLGVTRSASPAEIKAAYRRNASIHHPDKGGDARRFDLVRKAYETLIDPVGRAEYDKASASPPSHGGSSTAAPQRSPGPDWSPLARCLICDRRRTRHTHPVILGRAVPRSDPSVSRVALDVTRTTPISATGE